MSTNRLLPELKGVHALVRWILDTHYPETVGWFRPVRRCARCGQDWAPGQGCDAYRLAKSAGPLLPKPRLSLPLKPIWAGTAPSWDPDATEVLPVIPRQREAVGTW